MLLRRAVLERIVSGEVTLVFRRWLRPSVRAGGTLKTTLGVLAIYRLSPRGLRYLDGLEASS